ncbi:MAG TPA: glycine betaine ABC transporter substrate-binding protein, partial [Solirubrobacterales bacterium]
MRPRTLDEVIGQEHVLGEGSALRTAIESGKPHSAILYGPPGAGKTTLARIAAAGAQGAFEEQSAVNAGKAEIRSVIERARERRKANGRPTILFLDEIHRFNKAQQDALLPAVEEGLLTLIGATTENPYFEVNSALLSRAQIYELRPLEPEQVEALLRRALNDPERGIANPPAVSDEALEMLARRSGGDARVALSALERAVERADGEVDVAAVFTTEGQLAKGRYVVLKDPRGVFASQHLAPIINAKVLRAHGAALAETINAVSRQLTTPAMRRMNAAVDLAHEKPADVAAEFLREHDLIDA